MTSIADGSVIIQTSSESIPLDAVLVGRSRFDVCAPSPRTVS